MHAVVGRLLKLLDHHHSVLAIFLLAMGLRISVAVLFPIAPFSDFEWYFVRAQEIASGLGYQEHGHPTAFWPVGYPAILAGLILLMGNSVLSGVIGNIIFAAITFWAMVGLGRSIGFSERAVRIGALCWAVYLNAIFYVTQLASEGPYIALLLAATWAILVPRRWPAVLSGALLGVATLVKAQTYLFPVGLLLLIWFAFPDQRNRRLATRGILLYLALFAVVLPWTARNQHVLGSPVLVSTNGGITLLNGNNDLATGGYINDQHNAALEAIYSRTGIPKEERIARQVEFDQRTKALGWAWIKDHPVEFAKLMPGKFVGLWLVDGDAAWAYETELPNAAAAIRPLRIVDEATYVAILAGALLASLLMIRRSLRERPLRRVAFPELVLLAFPIFITMISLLFSGQSRFHAPAMPFLILLAAHAAVQIGGRNRRGV